MTTKSDLTRPKGLFFFVTLLLLFFATVLNAGFCPTCGGYTFPTMMGMRCSNPYCLSSPPRTLLPGFGLGRPSMELSLKTANYELHYRGSPSFQLPVIPMLPALAQPMSTFPQQFPQIQPAYPQQLSSTPLQPVVSPPAQATVESTVSENSCTNRAVAEQPCSNATQSSLHTTLETLMSDFNIQPVSSSELSKDNVDFFSFLARFAEFWTKLSTNSSEDGLQRVKALCGNLRIGGVWPPAISSGAVAFDNALDCALNEIIQNREVILSFFSDNRPFLLLNFSTASDAAMQLPGIKIFGIYRGGRFHSRLSLESLRTFLFQLLHEGHREQHKLSVLIFKKERGAIEGLSTLQLTD